MISAQWATSSAIPRTHNPLLPASEWDLLLHAAHNYVGIAIGATVLARVALRLARRADGPVHDRVPAEFAAAVGHWGIYAAPAVQAASGFVASYLWLGAVAIHKAAWNVTLVLVALHVAAAAWHALRGDGVIGSMRPRLSGRKTKPPGR